MDTAIAQGLQVMMLDPGKFQMSGQKSLRGPCPKCGGTRRLVIFLNGEFPWWYEQCSGCGLEGWLPDIYPQIKPGERKPISITRDIKDYSQALQALQCNKLDVVFHGNLDDGSRTWFRANGIPDSQQDFLRLGRVHGRPFRKSDGSGVMVLDAFTFPKFTLGWELHNIDFRLINPPDNEGKYRPFPGAPPTAFLTRPDLSSLVNESGKWKGTAFVVEGSKKAMVTSTLLDGAQVIGVPSKDSWADIATELQGAPLVYVILDPDAWVMAKKLCSRIGPNAHQVTIPAKIDDAVLAGMTLADFEGILRLSRRSR